MTKCDFCTQSDSNGKCPWLTVTYRKQYCNAAIKQMVKALGSNKIDTNRGKLLM